MNSNKFKIISYFGGGISLLFLADLFDYKNSKDEDCNKISEFEITELNKFPIRKIFQAEKFILREPLKKNFHISIPFNRKIQYIYNLDSFYYIDYENYNFNKLSDLFLNIHIFVN